MRVFTPELIGTKLTLEQKDFVIGECFKLYKQLSPEKVRKAIETMTDEVGFWSAEAEMQCIEHDMHFMLETLRTGIITMD